MDGGAWWAAVHGVAKSQTRLSDFIFTFHFHALEKEMATHSSVLAWRIPGTAEPGGLPSMGSHRVGHDWSDLAAVVSQRMSKHMESLEVHWVWKKNRDGREMQLEGGLGRDCEGPSQTNYVFEFCSMENRNCSQISKWRSDRESPGNLKQSTTQLPYFIDWESDA